MKQSRSFLKVAVIVSSVLLVGGLVSYRAGAFDWFMGTSAQSSGDAVMGGSKSKAFLVEPPSESAPSGPAKDSAIIMGGSKTIAITPLVSPPPKKTETPAPNAPAQPPKPAQ